MPEEMIIFTRMFDLLSWLVPRTENFPANQRFILTRRLLDAALDVQEHVLMANAFSGEERLVYLREADGALDKLRVYLRLSHHFHWLSAGQYAHVSQMVAEVGRLLGGWIQQTQGKK